MPSVLADPAGIARLIPTFWTDVYGDRNTVGAVVRGVATAGDQTADALAATVDAIAPATAAETRRTRWLRWDLSAADRTASPAIDYGDGYVFGPQPGTGQVFQFGRPSDQAVSYPLPAGVVGAAAVADLMAAPTDVRVVGVECAIANGRMTFLTDPLAGAESAVLWLADARTDASDVPLRYGTVLKLSLDSTADGLSAAATGYGMASAGCSDLAVRLMVGALCGAPCVPADETVEAVIENAYATVVVTDAAAYSYRPEAVPSVGVGDSVAEGTWPVEGVGVYSAADLPSTVTDVTLPVGLTGLTAAVTIPNSVVAVTTVIDSGHLKTEWAMGGDATAVTAFFAAAHAAGLALDMTIGDSLDEREDTSVPLATAVPATLNPFAVLVAQGLLSTALFAVMDADVCDAAGAAAAVPMLRPLMPPHVLLLAVAT